MLASFGVNAGKGSKFTCGFGQVVLVRLVQKHIRPDQRARVPLFGIAQGNGKCPQDATGALEAVELGPAGVEDIGEVWVEGVADQIALLRAPPLFLGLLVERSDAPHYRSDVWAESAWIANRLRFEKAPPQHLCHILLAHRTGVFFHLAAKDFGHFSQQFVTVLLPWVGGEQRGHHGAAVHFYDCLREVLEKADQAPARIRGGFDLSADIHQHLIDQH